MPAGPNSPRCIVCNSGPLIGLAGVGQLELLPRLYSQIITPLAVHQELTGATHFRHQSQIFSVSWLLVRRLGERPDALLLSELGRGEAEVITLAQEIAAETVLMDERKGRRIATLVYGLPVTGTGGILLAAKQAGLVHQIRPLMLAMKAHGYFLSDRLVEGICRAAGE
jgi:predicted nucleic acid-binding protein